MVRGYRKPHRFKKRKPIYRNRFFWSAILILIFFSSFFYFLFFTEFFQVEKINIVGLEQVSEEQLNLSIKDKLGNRILFFPTRNIFLLDLNKIKEDILEKIHRIAKIEIRRNFPDSLNVLVTERKIIATFCQEGEEDKSSSLPFVATREVNCFALDKEGIVFEEKPIDRTIQPLIKALISADEISLGKKVIEKEDLISILEINSQLKEDLNIPVKEFIISSKTELPFTEANVDKRTSFSSIEKLIAVTQDGWELYFDLQEDVKWQLTKLKALLEEKISEEQRKDLEYIELRFGNFANPKYKD
ncbi:MAG: FtsQ-type POTRA domain-containing protein [Candidatus Nealsonbacteria bacterium]|nr:FtsQ-type POTRA domain-containing protein [Candidatus Nealsonbacteria bacterium]